MQISRVTVTHNSGLVLKDCLASVASQSYGAVEHIVIDGGSKDETLEILWAHQKHLAVLVSEADCGIYDAMNKGINRAQGDVIGFLNSDDFYVKCDILERVARVFADDPSLDACYADLVYVDRVNTSHTVRYWQSKQYISGLFSEGWSPAHPTFFVRRSVYERLGYFNLSYRIASDVELMIRFIEVHKIRIRYFPEVWVGMRLGGTTNRSLKNIWIQNQEVLLALRSHGLPINHMRFWIRKIISRGKQFFNRPSL